MKSCALASRSKILAALLLISVFGCSISAACASSINYPQAEKIDVVDDYSGVKVHDSYRWLEDTNSEKTAAWVKKENAVTNAFLSNISARPSIKKRLTALWNYERWRCANSTRHAIILCKE